MSGQIWPHNIFIGCLHKEKVQGGYQNPAGFASKTAVS